MPNPRRDPRWGPYKPPDELSPSYGQRPYALPTGTNAESRIAPEQIAIGEPDYLRNLREQAMRNMTAGGPGLGVAAEGVYGGKVAEGADTMARMNALHGGPSVGANPGMASDLAYMRGQVSQAENEQLADMRSQAAEDVVQGEDWRQRQRALMQGIRMQDALKKIEYNKAQDAFARQMFGTIISTFGGPMGGAVGAGAQAVGGALGGGNYSGIFDENPSVPTHGGDTMPELEDPMAAYYRYYGVTPNKAR